MPSQPDLFLEFLNQFEGNQDTIRHFQAPARINIIGEHVDYLGGIVLPAAIDFSIECLIRPKDNNSIILYSSDFDRKTEINRPFRNSKENPWADYIAGVILELESLGHPISGFEMLIKGNIPQGAGLSSSAALEVLIGYSLSTVFQIKLTRPEIALIGQKAENNLVGMKCGIMDQFVIANGKKDHCLSLNTDSLEFNYHHFDLGENEFYLINSNVKHSLKDSEYNTRRKECESALSKITRINSQITNLYSFSIDKAEWGKFDFTENEAKRVMHVTSERERTKSVILALSSGNYVEVGKSLYECHWSLSQNFEVSCEEIDAIVTLLRDQGAIGARMIGGGFGGCVLVLDKAVNFFKTSFELEKSYQQKFGYSVEFYKFRISDGVKEITHS
ncbi:galactokinase [Leptospira ilyithenensis]|uniref:Galactokinase n=1 Tax=Leptospira ilyithenensis TaxID=2484901 RepID=A0A4R9LRA0_9LEPT|nr:galactokinase [Leptospira ilyithenensis]TGN11033.1 galactokinase [Leptospira ilyithenensis]